MAGNYQQRQKRQNSNQVVLDLEVSKPRKEKDKFVVICKATLTKGGVYMPDDTEVEMYDDTSMDPTVEQTFRGVAVRSYEYPLSMVGQEVIFTVIFEENNKPVKRFIKKPFPKEKEDKEKEIKTKDFSRILTVLALIKSRDISGKTNKKLEEWMLEMGAEKEIVFAALCKLPQESVEPIIRQIISKQDLNSRRNVAEAFGLYSMGINIERYSKILVEAETKEPASVVVMEKWLETLSPCRANYFKSSLSTMKASEGVEKYIFLSKISMDMERLKKAITLKLMIGE